MSRTIDVRMFGPLAVVSDEREYGPRDLGGIKPKRVLEILLVARGHRVPKDRLGELLWGVETQPRSGGVGGAGAGRYRAGRVPGRGGDGEARSRSLRRAAPGSADSG